MITTYFFIIINITVFLLYSQNAISTSHMCDKTLIANISQNFTHLEIAHIVLNLLAFYNLQNLELHYGSYKYAQIILILVLFQSFITYIINKNFNLTCSIGFSGVIFGLYMLDFFRLKDINTTNIMFALFMIIQPSLYYRNVSLSGHLIGGLSGFFLSFLLA